MYFHIRVGIEHVQYMQVLYMNIQVLFTPAGNVQVCAGVNKTNAVEVTTHYLKKNIIVPVQIVVAKILVQHIPALKSCGKFIRSVI